MRQNIRLKQLMLLKTNQNLTKNIIGQETNDYLKAKKIYEWICNNIIWTDPKPVMGDYAEYTAKYKRGDCSAKSNLFISLCRINKIPARSQGGWIIKPSGFTDKKQAVD